MIKFKGRPVRLIYNSDDFKIYAVDVSDEYKKVKRTKYGNVTITGNLHELSLGTEYSIIGDEETTKYGVSYRVTDIRPDVPKTEDEMFTFLQGILTFNQASALYSVYPDIVERVINGKTDDIDVSKLKGIGEKSLQNIITKIEDNYIYEDLIVKFENVLTISMLKKIHEQYPSIEKINELLEKDPYKFFTELSGVGFITADLLLIKLQKNGKLEEIKYDLMTSEQRCRSCVLYCLGKNKEEGNTKIPLFELKNMVEKLTPDCSGFFMDCLHDDKIYYNVKDNVVSFQYDYDNELFIADTIKQNVVVTDKWDYDILKYKNVDGYDLTDEQLRALRNLCDYKISILNGPAGSGKTATVTAIINMLKDNKKSFVLMSPTGKAAQVLSDYTHYRATTIHIGLCYDAKQNKWLINQDDPIKDRVVIVDEFSMVDTFLLRKLIDGIDFKTCRFLMVGDNNQLNSVGAGNCLHDMIVSNVVPKTTLTTIFRYSDGGLMKAATDVRNGETCIRKFDGNAKEFGKNKDYIFIKSEPNKIVDKIVKVYQRMLDTGYSVSDINVLSAYNKGAQGSIVINNRIQKIANPNFGNEKQVKVGPVIFYLGDMVLQTKNNYRARLYEDLDQVRFICNGEIGIIIDILDGGVVIKFKHATVYYDTNDLLNVSLGYAMSCHKSQGSQNKVIILATPSSHTYMLNSNLLYVGLTRTQEKCYHIGDITTVCRAVKKKANLQRKTFLGDMLKITSK